VIFVCATFQSATDPLSTMSGIKPRGIVSPQKLRETCLQIDKRCWLALQPCKPLCLGSSFAPTEPTFLSFLPWLCSLGFPLDRDEESLFYREGKKNRMYLAQTGLGCAVPLLRSGRPGHVV
jgi:hypothetical protein